MSNGAGAGPLIYIFPMATYRYACNGYEIRHERCSDIWGVYHPVDDFCFCVCHSLSAARSFCRRSVSLY